jgi:hypothetical protein
MRRQFWAALVGGGLSTALAVVTVISRDWIEFLFGADPDGGNGGLEWGIVVVTAVTAIVCFWWARVEWKRGRFSEVTHHA